MAGYRRFIAYVYEYPQGKKGNGRGFIKVEVKDGICRMQYKLAGMYGRETVPAKVYAYVRDKGTCSGIFLGDCDLAGNSVQFQYEMPEQNLGGSEYGLGDLCGILILADTGEMYGSGWDDQPLDISQIRLPKEDGAENMVLVRETEQEEAGREQEETEETVWEGILQNETERQREMKKREEQRQEEEGMSEEAQRRTEGMVPGEMQRRQEERMPQEMPGQREESLPGEMPGGEAERMPQEMQRQREEMQRREMQRQEEEIQRREMQRQQEEMQQREMQRQREEMQEREMQRQREELVPGEMQSRTENMIPENAVPQNARQRENRVTQNTEPQRTMQNGRTGQERNRTATNWARLERPGRQPDEYENGNMWREPESEWEEMTSQSAALKKEAFVPFFDNSITDCVKITPADFRYLGRRDRGLMNNRFVRYGFSQYGHLIVGRREDGRYILGVPGVYERQESVMAGMFGFPYFKDSGKQQRGGKRFGYWYRLIDTPQFHR